MLILEIERDDQDIIPNFSTRTEGDSDKGVRKIIKGSNKMLVVPCYKVGQGLVGVNSILHDGGRTSRPMCHWGTHCSK